MSTERDIIIERLEQKLAARDKEFAQMQESLRESVIAEMEKRFADKIKLRESTLDEIKMKFTEKVNEIIDMNKSLRDSMLEQRRSESTKQEAEKRMDRIERRLMELNSSYDGVMKELLDQKSILQEMRPKKAVKEEPKPKLDIKPKEEVKPQEKPKPRGEYIIAENYAPQERKKQQVMIEAEEKTNVADKPGEKEQKKTSLVKR
ncbi:MAG TPA: hypothetical protein VIO11_11060, partial [Candidatus Methanoperedens sp.]